MTDDQRIRIAAETAAERSKAVERLLELVRIESPSRHRDASARIADALALEYRALGGAVVRTDDEEGSHLVVDWAGEGAPLLLIGHSDTVWPIGTIDGAVPLVETADAIAGPGVFDMKSGLVVIETAMRIANRLGRRRAVRLVVTADEEIGSPRSRVLVESAASGAVGAIGFESPHTDGSLKIGRRGSTRLRVDVVGREAHAALDPGAGVSAADELIDQLLVIRDDIARISAQGREVLCNVGSIVAPGKANVVNAAASAELGLRFIDHATEREVLASLGELSPIRPGAAIACAVLSNRPAWLASAADAAFGQRLSEAAGVDLGGRPAAGAGDVNFVAALGIPAVDGFGPRGRGAHAVDEQIVTSALSERIEQLVGILLAVA
ncbi:M20/M25/M40 family metallo-hydrolase [Microbacterium paludicola]|uniref:M20/M25/M40 family metallo-hydrolase n=1 Tax=Microbacterium paludicola TaxID=300019 RepID=A0A4Y9FSA1_9MICO|nr:M20/M25/M40 family metallo-hydrolase [Microbacterium paludicola]MBF0817182.1 M20/M25/M40 family metallo-hydrolase [Microbacterium paludicola]TFU32109.1 M20/M25/M40 family metallo-hydrolase [Microbacterium paludicola]